VRERDVRKRKSRQKWENIRAERKSQLVKAEVRACKRGRRGGVGQEEEEEEEASNGDAGRKKKHKLSTNRV
jgi:succinyl-CoA synthetase beta subunit